MAQPGSFHNQREDQRIACALPVQINIGTQISLQGQLKDLSLKSAFIRIKGSIYLQLNDKLDFVIQLSSTSEEERISGSARISRIEVGEGFAIYFTKMENDSVGRLKKILAASGVV